MRRLGLVLLILLLPDPGLCQPADPFELIAPVRLHAGAADTVLMADLFATPPYPDAFDTHPAIGVQYDATAGRLVLIPTIDHEGLSTIPFTLGGTAFQLPVQTTGRRMHTFRFRPDSTATRVHAIGQFNDWSRSATPLADPDRDGTFEAAVLLEPGTYEYKFVVDGAEVLDQANPERVPNPFGDFNNLLTIAPRHAERAVLHLLQHVRYEDRVVLSFLYEGAEPPTLDDLVVLLGNRAFPPERIELAGQRIDLTLGGDALTGDAVARLAVTRGGQSTNIQTVRLHDGVPLGAPDTPFSWHDAVLYSLMIDRFLDGDSSNTRRVDHPDLAPKVNYHGGDFTGVLQKIDGGYFDSLGVNVLWLSPVNQNPDGAFREYPEPHRLYSGYHGYWPIHPTNVDDRFGDLDLLRTVVEHAHAHGIRVILDYVANHVHQEHPFFREYPDWFGTVDLPDGSKNIRLWDDYRLTTWFDTFLPSFDYPGSPEALDAMTDNAVWWLQQTGIDGFRHDAVKHIPNEFWRTLTRKIAEQIDQPTGRRTFQIGETFGSYGLIASYVNNGQLDAQFNFNLYDNALPVFLTDAPFTRLDAEQQRTFAVYGQDLLMGNLMDSHDKVRFAAYADGDISLTAQESGEIGWTDPPAVDDPASYRRARLYLAWMLTIPGVPTLYYGDEIGLSGAGDPDNRRPMRFGPDLAPDETAHLAEVRRLVRLRREHPALRYGDFLTLRADSTTYAYLRSDATERVLVALNKSDAAQTLKLDLPEAYGVTRAKDATTGEPLDVTDNRTVLDVPGIGWRVVVLR